MTSRSSRRQSKRERWYIVPREYVTHGCPSLPPYGEIYRDTEDEAWQYIQDKIDAAERIARTGSDYGACQLAQAETLTVVHESNLRPRTYNEARRLHYMFPQFYDAP
jgi:hypothetical protein